MLSINTGIKKDQGVTLMVNGMFEIVGRYQSEDEENVYLSKPQIAQAMNAGNGQATIGLQNYMMTADESAMTNVPIRKSAILSMVPANQHVDQSLREADSGIQLASQMPQSR